MREEGVGGEETRKGRRSDNDNDANKDLSKNSAAPHQGL